MFEPAIVDPAVDFLAALAGDGAALELGIGTGRIALPLARRGVQVHGIDLSEAMVARLRAKPGRRRDPGHHRRLRDDPGRRCVLPRLPRLQHDPQPDHPGRAGRLLPERRRTSRTRRLLRDRGRRPRPAAAAAGRDRATFTVSPTRLGFDEYDIASQGLISHHYTVVDGGLEVHSVPFRYAWPAELDLMARIAGMRLRERWGGWMRDPFTSDSTRHVSVWEKRPTADRTPAAP